MRFTVRFLLISFIFIATFLCYLKVQFEKLDAISDINSTLNVASNYLTSDTPPIVGSCNITFYVDESLSMDWVSLLYKKFNRSSVENGVQLMMYKDEYHHLNIYRLFSHNPYLQEIRLVSCELTADDINELIRIPNLKLVAIDHCYFVGISQPEVVERLKKRGLEICE